MIDEKDMRRINYGMKLLIESLKEGTRPKNYAKNLKDTLNRWYKVCPTCKGIVPIKMLSKINWEDKQTIYMNICPICFEVFSASVSNH